MPKSKDVELDNNLSDRFRSLVVSLQTLKQSITSVQQQLKGLDRQVEKQMRQKNKLIMKNRNKGNRKPSGFAKPSKISPELSNFMGKENGVQIARTEVTQYLIQYIKSNDLQYSKNKKIIMPDEKLKSLLGVSEKDEVTYFNLQRLMNKHFIKSNVENISENVVVNDGN